MSYHSRRRHCLEERLAEHDVDYVGVSLDALGLYRLRAYLRLRIPVYIINASYMLPLTLFIYFKYGRPPKPDPTGEQQQVPHCHSSGHTPKENTESARELGNGSTGARGHGSDSTSSTGDAGYYDNSADEQCKDAMDQTGSPERQNTASADYQAPTTQGAADDAHAEKAELAAAGNPSATPAAGDHDNGHSHGASSRPLYATIMVGVHHCGAGCVLGDLVGEWLVYGTDATIGGQHIWVELLVDYAFALLFGIAFQYFSIAPMSGEYGPKSVVRAAKADILSLTSFEIGLFGWMIIYQVGIWNYRLAMDTWTYWWMMQVGMAFGFATAMPVNWWLITKKIKEPCA